MYLPDRTKTYLNQSCMPTPGQPVTCLPKPPTTNVPSQHTPLWSASDSINPTPAAY